MTDKRRAALSLQENEELAEAVRTFSCLYDKSEKEYKDKNVVRTPGKKLQTSWTLLKTVSFLFWVNFRPKVQHGVPINLFLKTEDILTLSSHSKLSYKKGVRGGFRTLQTSKMELLTILSCQLLTFFAKHSI